MHLARLTDDDDAFDAVDEGDGVGVREDRRGQHDDDRPGPAALREDAADGGGGQCARHVLGAAARDQGEGARAGDVDVGAAVGGPAAFLPARGPAGAAPGARVGRAQLGGQGRGAQVGLDEQDVPAHLGEGCGEVGGGGARHVVVAPGRGDQEPAAFGEGGVVGEPEGDRPVLLGEPAAGASDREQGACSGALPGQGAEQWGAQRADEFPGGADGRVEDEPHPRHQQPEGESDDAAESEQQRQPRPGGVLRGDGLLVEVAGCGVQGAEFGDLLVEGGDGDDEVGPCAGDVVAARSGLLLGEAVALFGERFELGAVAVDHVVDAVLGALAPYLQVGLGERLGSGPGLLGGAAGVGELEYEGVGRVGDLEPGEQRADLHGVTLSGEGAGRDGAHGVADGGLAFGADVDALVGGGPGGEGVGGGGAYGHLAGGGVGVLAAQGEPAAAEEAQEHSGDEEGPVAQELAELVPEQRGFVLLVQRADRFGHRRRPSRWSRRASVSRASNRASAASRPRYLST